MRVVLEEIFGKDGNHSGVTLFRDWSQGARWWVTWASNNYIWKRIGWEGPNYSQSMD